ncbi:hypothetical protein OAU28_03155 [Flavobacteriales bacterium]|nr:hypothetical protein [Flavobacteriales bacterium]
MKETQTQDKFGFWLAIGVAIGTSIGVATENLQIWLPLGISMGALISFLINKSKQ